jgi:hypothetical protein
MKKKGKKYVKRSGGSPRGYTGCIFFSAPAPHSDLRWHSGNVNFIQFFTSCKSFFTAKDCNSVQVQKNMKQFVIYSLALIYCEYACVAIQAYISGDLG